MIGSHIIQCRVFFRRITQCSMAWTRCIAYDLTHAIPALCMPTHAALLPWQVLSWNTNAIRWTRKWTSHLESSEHCQQSKSGQWSKPRACQGTCVWKGRRARVCTRVSWHPLFTPAQTTMEPRREEGSSHLERKRRQSRRKERKERHAVERLALRSTWKFAASRCRPPSKATQGVTI